MENYKELLTALYKEHAPDKIDQVDFYLDRYKGKEKQFYITQKAKYAKKRSVTDSKKILEEAIARIKAQKEKAAKGKKVEPKKAIPQVETNIDTDNKPTIKETPKPKKKVDIIGEKIEKPKVKEAPKKKIVIAEDVKKDVIISETPKTAEIKLGNTKKEKKEITIIDTTSALNPALKKPKEKTVINPPVKEKIKESQNETVNPTEDKERKLNDLEQAKKRLAESRTKEDKKSKTIWYVAAIALFVLIIASVVYFMNFYISENANKKPVKVQKVIIENKKISTEENSKPRELKEEEKPAVEKVPATEKEEPKKVEKVEKPKKKEVKKEPIKKQAKTHATAERLYSNDFDHPAVFVSCFAVKSESLAQKKVSMLKGLNLDAHYYWIPGMDVNGNPFFKVVIGPFTGLNKAYPSLTKVQERVNFDAYILIVQ